MDLDRDDLYVLLELVDEELGGMRSGEISGYPDGRLEQLEDLANRLRARLK